MKGVDASLVESNGLPNIAVVTVLPAPYRIALFNQLGALADVQLDVLVTQPESLANSTAMSQCRFHYQTVATQAWYRRDRHGDLIAFVWSPGLWKYFRRVKYDAIVVLGWTMPNTLLARVAGALRQTPVILWDESIPHPPSRIKKMLMPLLQRYIGSFDGYLAASSGCREYMIAMGAPADRVFIFPQVADVSFFKAQSTLLRAQRTELKKAHGIETARVFLFVGQLIPRKGVLYLLDAFEQIAAQDSDVSLVLVGEGVLRAELQARRTASKFQERIFIQPFASQQELPTYYALADVFVLPSLYDTFGVVVNEAMASGLPVVTTRTVGAVADLVSDGVNGCIVPPGDADALAHALLALVRDEPRRQSMGENARKRIEQWTIVEAAGAFEKCLALCLKGQRAAR